MMLQFSKCGSGIITIISSGNLLEMQILGPDSKSTEADAVCKQSVLSSPPEDSDVLVWGPAVKQGYRMDFS